LSTSWSVSGTTVETSLHTEGRWAATPLGIAALEDKLVQQAVVTILNQIYEVDFKGFSYGFRPGRSPHQALDALTVGIQRKRVNWVLDADIRGFFDNLSHEWTMKFIQHRVADRRMLRLIQKWLKAEVSEDGQWSETKTGTPQGVSPLLANMYLHYVFDLRVEVWRKKVAPRRSYCRALCRRSCATKAQRGIHELRVLSTICPTSQYTTPIASAYRAPVHTSGRAGLPQDQTSLTRKMK
jgi:retron-type reverse transcriptase